MGEIKSAHEIAMAKIGELGEATDEERLGWKYVPEGEQLAGKYLKKDCNLVAEIDRYEEKVKKYITRGAAGVLIRNIGLPVDDRAKKNNKRAMDGLKALKSDKVGVGNVYNKIRGIFNHYAEQGEQQRQQSYASLKAEFEVKVREALQQQLGSPIGIDIDVESQPQFQEEWHRLKIQLDAQYLRLLEEYKQELSGIS